MKNYIRALFVAVGFSLPAASAGYGKSQLVSIFEQPLWPTSSTPNGNLVYEVMTVARAGSGLLEVTLTAGNLPPGVTVTFSPSVLRFTGTRVSTQTAQMIVSCPCVMPIDSYPFTIT